MRAMLLTGLRQSEIRDIPGPRLAADTDVRLRMGAVGICGSDVHYYLRGKIGSQVVQYPFAVGHEGAGTVVEVGPRVPCLTVGDRVTFDPAMPCGQCDQCRAGRAHTCRKLKFLGCPGQAEGCLCDELVMPEECCFPIGEATTLDQAALVEPLSIGLYAVKLSGVSAGAKVGILGAGPIGLSVLLPARAAGAAAVYMTDKLDDRLAVARAGGADWTGNPNTEAVVKQIYAAEPAQLDIVFECCGDPAALDQAVEMLKPGGKLMIVGIPEVDRISFDIDELRHKELAIQNVRRQNGCVQAALDMIEGGRIDVDFMITHHFGLEQVTEAFELVADYRDGVVKAMVSFD